MKRLFPNLDYDFTFLLFEKGYCAYSDDFESSRAYAPIPEDIWHHYGGAETARKRENSMEDLSVLEEKECHKYMKRETAEWIAFYKLLWERPDEWRIPSRLEIKYRAGTLNPVETSRDHLRVPPPVQLNSLNYEKSRGKYVEPKLQPLKKV